MYHKIYQCKKCGSHNFFMEKLPHHKTFGLYCFECGAWLKWGNKDDVRLFKNGKAVYDYDGNN